MTKIRRPTIIGLVCAFVLGAVITGWFAKPAGQLMASTSGMDDTPVCGKSTAPPLKYQHVIWILEENKPLGKVVGSPDAPFITNLADQCAYSTNFLDNEPRQAMGAGYHSLSHYLADTSGSDCVSGNGRHGIGCVYLDQKDPLHYTLPSLSLFQQVEQAGGTWRSYQESSPYHCSLANKGLYTFRHDAAVYYSNLHKSCQQNDIPIPTLANVNSVPRGQLIEDIQNNVLPTFSYVTPNLDHDMHNGTVAQGDAWLQAYLQPLFRSHTWAEGRTAVFVIWDEAPKANQTLPNLVITPTARGGAVTVTANGFAVLRTTEQMLGLPFLGCATGQVPGGAGSCYSGATADLRSAFHI